MTASLPPNLLALFAPRDPIPFRPPIDKLPHEKKRSGYTGVSSFLGFFEHPSETPPATRAETKEERKERRRRERAELQAYKIEQGIAMWNVNNNERASEDPYKTLFVSRISYDTTESKLRREFEAYGQVKKVYMVTDSEKKKSRGYAFVEYEHERDMHSAYKHADGKKIDGRRVLVDVERGRTVKGWLPRRFGGGLGDSRRPRAPGGGRLEDADGAGDEVVGGSERSRSRDKGREKDSSKDKDSGRDRDRRRRSKERRSRSRDRGDRGDRSERKRSKSRDREVQDRRRDRRDRDRDRGDRADRKDRDRDRNDRSVRGSSRDSPMMSNGKEAKNEGENGRENEV